jgi:Fic family protein
MANDRKRPYRVGTGEGIRRHWAAGQSSLSGGRRAREGFYYYAFKGWPIAELAPSFSGELTQDIAAAESELRRLNGDPPHTQLLEAVARQLLRAEAVASSRVEGLELSHRKLAQAAFDPEDTTVNARTVLGNVRALEEAIRLASSTRAITVDSIRAIHRKLFEGTRQANIAGLIRTRQNWIGGRDTPWGAAFIPVPEHEVPRLLDDLCQFLRRDDLPAVVQAAIAHAQFETIHPFEDGNGRVGRALIHVILRRRGVAPHYVPPVSLILAANYSEYERGLIAYRDGDGDTWSEIFARAVAIACSEAEGLAGRIAGLKERWRAAAELPRRGSAADKLIEILPVHPVIDLRTSEKILGISDEAVRLGIERLQQAGVVREITYRKRGRAWESVGLFAVLDEFERRLARTGPGQERPAPRPAKPKSVPAAG